MAPSSSLSSTNKNDESSENVVSATTTAGGSFDNNDNPNSSSDFYGSSEAFETDPCLEGTLLMRKGRATGNGSIRWRKRYVHLSFANQGSMSVYRETPESIKYEQVQEKARSQTASERRRGVRAPSLYSKFHNRMSAALHDPINMEDLKDLLVFVPSHLPWVAKDVENTAATFVVEIPTNDEGTHPGLHIGDALSLGGDQLSISPTATGQSLSPTASGQTDAGGNDFSSVQSSVAESRLNDEISRAKKRGKPVRIYFSCRKGQSEKALWMGAFSKLGRLSLSTRHTHGIISAVVNGVKIRNNQSRIRTNSDVQFAADARRIVNGVDNYELDDSEREGVTGRINEVCFGKPTKEHEGKEYLVLPGYAYPHRWMTIRELHAEMIAESDRFHDCRLPHHAEKEIGHLKVEVLQCVGLPRLDRLSETDAVVYLVCGPCAFATDVIPDRLNPMWLRKTRRACIFPIFHGYARMYVGVFDDDGEKAKDDLAGRVVIDISRLRHSSQYDVTLPLRMSTHAYSRRKRGAIRLRFTLFWKTEKGVLLSYVPKKVKFKKPKDAVPDLSTTIACADAKSFRNTALTVHGVHMPGRFTFAKVKAAIREINFTRKYVIGGLRQEIKDLVMWVNPTISAYVWCSWMHCVYLDKFSLVPGYFVVFVLLQLLRTYALYGMEGPYNEGFLPPTIEEMFDVLVKPSSATSIEPLHMHRTSNAQPSYKSQFEPSKSMHIRTHEPKGRLLFKLLGFLPWKGSICDKRNLHLEFPMADGGTYERLMIKDCLAEREAGEETTGVDGFAEEESQFESVSMVSTLSKDASAKTSMMGRMRRSNNSKRDSQDESESSEEEEPPDVNNDDNQINDSDSDDEMHPREENVLVANLEHAKANIHTAADAVNPMNLVVQRDQDMDWKSGKKEKLTDLLEKVSFKMHSITFQNFNDNVYYREEHRRNPDSLYFGDSKNIEKRRNRSKKKHVDRKLDKLLDARQYSDGNPLISRLGLYISPIIDAVFGYLCGFRFLFNVLHWQDPYLTFMIFVFLSVLALVLFIIPWRPTLFVAGMLFVGPQNFAIRLMREHGIIPPKKPKEKKEEVVVEEEQQIFHGSKRLEGTLVPKPPPEVPPEEIQHIVVPYGPLQYQRMYDWPPEKQFATVEPAYEDDSPALQRGVSDLTVSETIANTETKPKKKLKGSRYPRLHKLRRRIGSGNAQEMSKLLEVNSELDSGHNEAKTTTDPLAPHSKDD